MMAKASLSDVPKSPHELEDYVAALFQSSGHFVEKNIVERDFTEILELDVVATSYEQTVPCSILAEAKSGDWGFPDIFKVVGWMRYLDIQRGAFFVSKQVPGKDMDSVQKKVAPLGVSFVHLGDFSDASDRFRNAGFPQVLDGLQLVIWRYVYWLERNLIDKLKANAKSNKGKLGPSAALAYHRLVNDGIFFVKDPRDSLCQLYSAYKDHPRLSLGVAKEMEGAAFDPEAIDPTNKLLREAMLFGSHDLLQCCFYLEHRARLAIFKAAIDYVCHENIGMLSDPMGRKIDINRILLALLPASFQNGLRQLKAEPYFNRYALFWQVFLWGFGGFYLEDRKETEFKWLSEQTGIPVGEIPRALKAFDVLFPAGHSWITQAGRTHCTIVKMCPIPVRGLGAYHRLNRYGLKQFPEFGYADHTVDDLIEWNNHLVRFLTE